MDNQVTVKRQLNNYKMVDIVKYISAIMVICIHCSQVFPQEYIDFFIKNIICRIAVPFFFISSAYFIRKGCYHKEDYVKSYLKRLSKSYLLWSLVFVPIGLDWIHQNLNIAGSLLPFALILGLVHVGTYYHLWYIPAMIFALFIVDKLLKHISYKIIFFLSILFYLFGSLETYSSFIPSGLFKDSFDNFIKVIFTTRSGLFYGMIFVVIGFYIYDNQEKLKSLLQYIPLFTLLSGVLLIVEGSFLYYIPKLDMNFLIMLVPFGFFFFIWVLSFPYIPQYDTKKIRELSKYYYFVHPVCIVIIEEIGRAFHLNVLSSGFISLLFIILFTHILSLVIIEIQKHSIKYSNVFISACCGIIITFIMASLLYQWKPIDIFIRFEWVPCIWFLSSFIVYGWVVKKNFRLDDI